MIRTRRIVLGAASATLIAAGGLAVGPHPAAQAGGPCFTQYKDVPIRAAPKATAGVVSFPKKGTQFDCSMPTGTKWAKVTGAHVRGYALKSQMGG